MGGPSNKTSGKHQSSAAPNASSVPPSNILEEPEVSASIRKEVNADSCPLFKMSNDEFNHIFGYVGEKQYGFVACISDRFHQVYLEAFGDQTLASIASAVVSVSRAQLCLSTERPNGASYSCKKTVPISSK